ncbi:MAG: hypothetical protein ACW96U_00890 [Candidatus Heimdallarchaeaceae archaeon]|jgi:Holliday junction resolvasome RuvABC endonuclease subunit
MNVLALDTGTQTGWALLFDKKKYHGTQMFKKKDCDDNGVVFTFFRAWLESMIRSYHPDVIVYEQPHFRGAGTQILVGLVTSVQELCNKYDVKWMEIHSKTLKLYATGFGNASKEQMMEKAREKKWKFDSDDECDALWLLEYISKESNVI